MVTSKRTLLGALVLVTAAACAGSETGSDSAPSTTEARVAAAPTSVPPDTVPPETVPPETVPPETVPPETVPADLPDPDRAIDRVPTPEASTVDELLALGRPVVIAHAGGDFEAPHSTMYAFTQAALAGTDVLEMDVMLSADDVLVVHHDDTVDRTTGTTGQVSTFTYDELAALDNAHWFVEGTWSDRSRPDGDYTLRGVRTGDRPAPDGYGPDDFRIETFRSIATAFPDHVLDVEIKVQRLADGTPDTDRANRAAAVLAVETADLGRTDSVIVVSFDAATLATFRELAPDVATSPGLDTLVAWYVGEPVEFAPTDVVFQVPPVYEGVEVLTPDVVARAQGDGFDVWVWMDDTSTQENADFYRDLLARGVDGLLVSRPRVAVEVVGTP